MRRTATNAIADKVVAFVCVMIAFLFATLAIASISYQQASASDSIYSWWFGIVARFLVGVIFLGAAFAWAVPSVRFHFGTVPAVLTGLGLGLVPPVVAAGVSIFPGLREAIFLTFPLSVVGLLTSSIATFLWTLWRWGRDLRAPAKRID